GLSIAFTATAGPFSGTAAPNAAVTKILGVTGTNTQSATISAANFALWTSPPAGTSVSLSFVGGNGTFGGTAGTNVFFGGSANAGGVTTVTYSYLAPTGQTPEPATMAMLGGGLLALGLL